MSRQDLRRWAIEQAVALHGAKGTEADVVVNAARMLLRFVDQAAANDDEAAG